MIRTHILAGLFFSVLSGCTNSLYQGNATGPDAFGNNRNFLVYWTKTEQLFGTTKAGPIILKTECSTRALEFSDLPEGIVFRGEPQRDRLPDSDSVISQDQTCGTILHHTNTADIPAGNLQIVINCVPVADEFSSPLPNYPKARAEPHSFNIIEKIKRTTLLGETLPAPDIECMHP